MLDFSNSNFYGNPTPKEEDINLSMQKLLRTKTAKLTSYNVKIFDTSKEEDRKEYEELMPKIIEGVYTKKVVIWAKEKALIDGVWKIYLEWSEYTVEKQNEETNE